jgi:predicted methyltransferase
MTQNLPPMLTSVQAKAILAGKTDISLDLGLSKTRIKPTEGGYILGKGEFIDDASVEKIAKTDGAAYFVDKKSVFMAATSGKHFYKLIPTAGAPTIEIDGIRMHRTKDTTPDLDAIEKLNILNIRGGIVLDTCMGLGYTAIQSVRRGASYVVSVEFEPNVLRISKINPWSKELYSSESIHKLIGDSFHVVDAFSENQFDYVIHDPPRHSSAGHLYGQEFYKKLAHVIKDGGRMFHYTGEPGSKYRKVNIHTGVKRRLRQAGFNDITYHPKVMGFTCTRTV